MVVVCVLLLPPNQMKINDIVTRPTLASHPPPEANEDVLLLFNSADSAAGKFKLVSRCCTWLQLHWWLTGHWPLWDQVPRSTSTRTWTWLANVNIPSTWIFHRDLNPFSQIVRFFSSLAILQHCCQTHALSHTARPLCDYIILQFFLPSF